MGLRRSRYHGVAKTHLQHQFTAAALNLSRIDAFITETPRGSRRMSHFRRLRPAPNPLTKNDWTDIPGTVSLWPPVFPLDRIRPPNSYPVELANRVLSSGQGETHRLHPAHSTAPCPLGAHHSRAPAASVRALPTEWVRTGWTVVRTDGVGALWMGAPPHQCALSGCASPRWCAPAWRGGAVSGAHRVRSPSREPAPGADRASLPECRRCPGGRSPG